MTKRILFLAANPEGEGMTQLALDEECREITEKLRAAEYRESLELITRWAVRPEDLLQHLNEHKPYIVHFSGHGTPDEAIILLDRHRLAKPVTAAALKQLLGALRDNIRVVVLNACFSRPQAEAITEVIDCAIGMRRDIGDDAAIVFAAAFYQAIGFGRSVQAAFDSGKAALMLEGIDEEKTPELLVRKGVDPAKLFLIEQPAGPAPKLGEADKQEAAHKPVDTDRKEHRLEPEIRVTVFVALCAAVFMASAAGASLLGWMAALLLPLPLLVGAYHWRDRWLPRFSRYAWMQVVTLIAIYLSSVFYLPGEGVFASVGAALIGPFVQRLPDPVAGALRSGAFGPALILAAGLAVNVLVRRREVTWATANPNPVSWVSAGDFRVSLQRYCDALVAELDRYDREVNWSDRDLTPLEAEVETEGTERLRPRIARDLVEAIRRDRRSSVFVVLGDPGSGKSVSLRRLVRVLCGQAVTTGVVPVYVNLREYPPDEEITPESLLRFIQAVTWRQTGRDGRSFLNTWYEPFRKSGRLFFVIDSFDELPAILDCDEKSDMHRRVSAAFDRFFTQEILTCRSVLASRQFRAPVEVVGTRLVIRPFTEIQIRRAMRTWLQGKGVDTLSFVHRLFQSRPHLVPLLRNPFTAELIAEWATTGHGTELPLSMYEVFNEYLTKRLEEDQRSARSGTPDAAVVRTAAGLIATEMYKTRTFGLEADVDAVIDLLTPIYGSDASRIVEALRYARLARVGGADRRRFSFVHRRFAEFFVVDAFRTAGGTIDLTSIPTDSRWRDCLVMCCGVLDVETRQRVAEYCWSVIDQERQRMGAGDIGESQAAVHCIRFLADAFRADPEALASFREPLGKLVKKLLSKQDLLVAKIAAELIPLVDDLEQQPAIVTALERRSRWISDTTLNACRHFGRMNAATNQAIRDYFNSFSVPELLHRYRDLNFSLSLSEAFRTARRSLRIAVAEVVCRGALATAFLAFAVIDSPGMLLTPLALVAVVWAVHSWVVTGLALPDYRGVLLFRDWIDAWSRLLIVGISAAYFPGEKFALESFLAEFLPAASSALVEEIHLGWRALIFALSILVCHRWEDLQQFARRWRKRSVDATSISPDSAAVSPDRSTSINPFKLLIREPTLKNAKGPGILVAMLTVIIGLPFVVAAVWRCCPTS